MHKKDKIKELLERGVEQVIVKDSLAKRLSSGKRLRVKLGIDPTSPRLHLGHTVVLRKLRQFQELGHTIIFLVGDFTARIGDPSGRLSKRKPLTESEIIKNMDRYRQQVGKVLDLKRVEIRHNSEWHREMDFAELFELTSLFTVNQMLERDMFQERMKQHKPLWVHELLYPILQGYDSVALQADLELGGTDQTFNVLAARTIQPHYNQAPQEIMTVQLLEGTDGTNKMSKSIGNTIELDDTPREMFGQIMSIPDKLISKYFTLLTDLPLSDINDMEEAIKRGSNPKEFKLKLARTIVALYHGETIAQAAEEEFDQIFRRRESPTEIPIFSIKKGGRFDILGMLVDTKLAPSKSEARRLVEQGGVQLDGVRIGDWKARVTVKNGSVLKVGKRKYLRFQK